MATKIKKRAPDILDTTVAKTGDLEKLSELVKAKPVASALFAGFVILCVLAGLGYRMTHDSATRKEMTEFARAVDSEDAGVRAADLEPLSKKTDSLGAEALYLEGESQFEAAHYDKAKEAFDKLRQAFPDSPYVPDAVEGLGFIQENAGQFDQAVTTYQEIIEKWRDSFTALRQQFNIARCQEQLKNIPAAIAAYQAEVEAFPGSTYEKESKEALERLKKSNPDLFPKEEAKKEEAAPAKAEGATPEATTEQPPLEKSKAETGEAAKPEASASEPAPAPAAPAPVAPTESEKSPLK